MNGKSDIDQLKADLEILKADMSKLVRGSRDAAGRKADEVRVQARGEFDDLVQEVAAAIEGARGEGAARLRAVEHQIEQRPFISLASAFAVGMIVGRLFDRR